MNMDLILAGLVFAATFAAITIDKVHKTLVALAGAIAVLLLGLVSQEEAFSHVDWNVIFLLAGMMIIANTLRQTGVYRVDRPEDYRLGACRACKGDAAALHSDRCGVCVPR
jgi:Na+/H+ antiporter NhaD/arsenite permease-like protein